MYGLFNKTFVRSWVNLIFETKKPNVNKGSYVNNIKTRHAVCSILGNKADDDTAIKFGRKCCHVMVKNVKFISLYIVKLRKLFQGFNTKILFVLFR